VRRLALPLFLSVFLVVGSFGAPTVQPDRRAADWFMVLLLLKASLPLYWLGPTRFRCCGRPSSRPSSTC
jgi:hypothetical protein